MWEIPIPQISENHPLLRALIEIVDAKIIAQSDSQEKVIFDALRRYSWRRLQSGGGPLGTVLLALTVTGD